MPETGPLDLGIGEVAKQELESRRNRELCLASTTVEHKWAIDVSGTLGQNRVYLEVQFGKKEAAVMDVCRLQVAYYEKHLSLGIQTVIPQPKVFFAQRGAGVSGMAKSSAARQILAILGLEYPVWLLGLVQ